MEYQNMADIKEIKSSTKFILKRLNNVTGCGNACKCASELDALRKDFQAVEERVNGLALIAIDLQNEETDEQRFNHIQTNIEEVRQSLLALKTDDSEQMNIAQNEYSKLWKNEFSRCENGSAAGAYASSGASVQADSNSDDSPGKFIDGAVWRIDALSNNPLNVTEQRLGNETNDQMHNAHRTSSATTNVSRKPQSTEPTAYTEIPVTQVIRQTERDFVIGDGDYWKAYAQRQLDDATRITRHEESIRTVLCLDISESMASGNAWSQVKIFVNDFLNGLELLLTQFGPAGLKQEYVGVATFGHETKLQQLATANFSVVREKIDHLQLGGPSPLYGGLWVSVAGAMCCRALASTGGGIIISPRVIVITDGKPTETGLRGGPDIPAKRDETVTSILSCLEEIQGRGTSIFFVGVGDYDEEFLQLITPQGRKTVFGYKDGRRLAKRTYLCTKTTLFDESFGLMRSFVGLSVEDEEDMQDIRADTLARVGGLNTLGHSTYSESKNDSFPVIGSRVRRGPDWIYGTQDHYGVGTVVGHSEEEFKVWVTWDFDNLTTVYRYGMGEYDVLVTDEPRELKHGENIAIGCRVKQGRDARSQDVSASTQGVVLRLNTKKAYVRWDNGKRGDYSYGADGRYEIELCTSQGQTSGSGNISGYSTRPNKNKISST